MPGLGVAPRRRPPRAFAAFVGLQEGFNPDGIVWKWQGWVRFKMTLPHNTEPRHLAKGREGSGDVEPECMGPGRTPGGKGSYPRLISCDLRMRNAVYHVHRVRHENFHAGHDTITFGGV